MGPKRPDPKSIGKFVFSLSLGKFLIEIFVWGQWDRRFSNIYIYIEFHMTFFRFCPGTMTPTFD